MPLDFGYRHKPGVLLTGRTEGISAIEVGDDRSSHAGDVRGEEVHAVAVEVAAGAVVMLGGPWVGVPGQELGGIGKKVSTITTLSELASTALREALWRDAETLVPKSYVANAATSEPDAKAAVDAPAPKKDAPAKKSVSSAPKKRAANVREN